MDFMLIRQLYAKPDDPTNKQGPRLVTPTEATELNQRGFGIFWSVNDFKGARRIKNLSHLHSWFFEIDSHLDKPTQLALIKSSPIVPSLVIESKNGYHVYFNARGPTSLEKHRLIEKGLTERFKADPRATLVTQLARAPGYMHLKDPAAPFLVMAISQAEITYTEKVMLKYFPTFVKPKGPAPRLQSVVLGADAPLREKLSTLDNEVALSVLSGKACVNHEVYTFESVSRARKNIFVNGKSTSCFIDENKRIGAKPGGPTVWQWLKYYGHSDREVALILQQELGL